MSSRLFLSSRKTDMKSLPGYGPIFLILGILLVRPSPGQAEPGKTKNFIEAGIGLEQLNYSEQIPDIELYSSDTELTNWILYLEAQKGWQNLFIGARAYIPVSTDESLESWAREGVFEQTNSLTYSWSRAEILVGYFLHNLLNPYVGISWAYSKQERSNFNNIDVPEIILETYTEEVDAFSALFGIKGNIPSAPAWAFSYYAQFQLPFYSRTTNTGLPGWEASDIGGYGYTLAARLAYSISETATAALQVSGGRLHWEGSDWLPAGNSSAKWPENDTDFLNCLLIISRHF